MWGINACLNRFIIIRLSKLDFAQRSSYIDQITKLKQRKQIQVVCYFWQFFFLILQYAFFFQEFRKLEGKKIAKLDLAKILQKSKMFIISASHLFHVKLSDTLNGHKMLSVKYLLKKFWWNIHLSEAKPNRVDSSSYNIISNLNFLKNFNSRA